MLSYNDIFFDKQRVLFVTAHPDDVDVLFGGLLVLLNKNKKETFVLLTTNGGRGSKDKLINEEDLSQIRISEEKQALNILGTQNENFTTLNYLDGELESNLESIGQISFHIRKFRPDIVCTHQPRDIFIKYPKSTYGYINHKDHRITGQITLDAIYPFSRDHSFFPQHFNNPDIREHHVRHILLGGTNDPNCQFDITTVIGQKRQALLSHKSQFDENTVNRILNNRSDNQKHYEQGLYFSLPW